MLRSPMPLKHFTMHSAEIIFRLDIVSSAPKPMPSSLSIEPLMFAIEMPFWPTLPLKVSSCSYQQSLAHCLRDVCH